jgi:hypothetical protein
MGEAEISLVHVSMIKCDYGFNAFNATESPQMLA